MNNYLILNDIYKSNYCLCPQMCPQEVLLENIYES